ncbi:hypothetical protein N9764_06215 [Polaribacter sp.]|nr:hypothetical protein [Polaribacter sp.]
MEGNGLDNLVLLGAFCSWSLLQSYSTVKKRDARYKEGFRILKSSPKTIFINIILTILFAYPMAGLLYLFGVK